MARVSAAGSSSPRNRLLAVLHQAIKPLTESNGNNHVIFAVHYPYWRGDLASAQIRAKPVLHEYPHRREPVVLRADVDCRSKRSFQHDTPDRVLGCQRERQRIARPISVGAMLLPRTRAYVPAP
jgi:hypothetical protein